LINPSEWHVVYISVEADMSITVGCRKCGEKDPFVRESKRYIGDRVLY
jgi:hypothetical protein